MNDALRAARAARGLPDYDRPPPPAPKPERPKPQRMVRCSKCAESFTADSFKAAGSANKQSKVCDACFVERYPKRKVQCSRCGKAMTTRGKCRPKCRPCRRASADQAPPPPPYCVECLEPITGVVTKAKCWPCYMREWRARHGVNSRGRVGAWTHEPARAA